MRFQILCLFFLLLLIESASATEYYVSTSGSDSNPGLSAAQAWKTITYAATKTIAGDTVNIKSGDYGHEHVVISKSGTNGNPITFKGYGGTVSLNGNDRNGTGITITGSYIIVDSLNVTLYETGIGVQNVSNLTLQNIDVSNLGYGLGYSGVGIRFGSVMNSTLKNCTVTDARAVGITLWRSHNNLVENCKVIGIETYNPMDYYFVIGYSHDNMIRNCLVQNKHTTVKIHPGHGIGVKDAVGYSYPHSYNNIFENCTSRGIGESLYVAHQVYDNKFLNCSVYDDGLSSLMFGKAITFRDGSHNNLFSNCSIHDQVYGIYSGNSGEGDPTLISTDNVVENCLFESNIKLGLKEDLKIIILFKNNAKNNIIKNCVFDGYQYLSYVGPTQANISGNVFKNSVVMGAVRLNSAGLTYRVLSPMLRITFSDFYTNKFTMPVDTGNIAADPLFVDKNVGDYRLKVNSPCIGTGEGGVNMGLYSRVVVLRWPHVFVWPPCKNIFHQPVPST